MRNLIMNTSSEDRHIETLRKELEVNNKDEFIKEQYKLIIDSAHKIAERAKDSNSVYITVNAIFAPFIIKLYEDKPFEINNFIIFIFLIGIGILICINWLMVMNGYKKINKVNYLIISLFEQYLPTSVFSLRAQISDPPTERGNSILYKEIIIPYTFIAMYILLSVIFLIA